MGLYRAWALIPREPYRRSRSFKGVRRPIFLLCFYNDSTLYRESLGPTSHGDNRSMMPHYCT